ncbi:translocation protein Sec62-domain-containing protein [Flagelloscypha sp. PMI_526]|nr:translocation protein Sec62-domain-containing protein [Flagelloscypha sp. PMI_526]
MAEQQTKAPTEVKEVAKFLRSRHAGVRIRDGALDGKRMACFKGKSVVRALLSPGYQKQMGVPKVETEADAIEVLQLLNTFAFYVCVQRKPSGISSSSLKTLHVVPDQGFDPDEYYVWLYEGSQWTTYAGAVLMVIVIFAGALFPIWPSFMHVGVHYISMTAIFFVGFIFIIAVNRLVVHIITSVVAPPGIWIFPRLFADVGFLESFTPLYE